jgi:hypothetical protein
MAGASPCPSINRGPTRDGQRPSQRRIVVATRSLGATSTLAGAMSLAPAMSAIRTRSKKCTTPSTIRGGSKPVLAFTGFDSDRLGLTPAAADCNALGTTGLAHRDDHGKDAVVVLGLDLVSIDGPGEGDGALKGASAHFTH